MINKSMLSKVNTTPVTTNSIVQTIGGKIGVFHITIENIVLVQMH